MINISSVNLKPFEEAWKFQESSETPFLQKLRQRAKKEQPYKGLNILHNVPISMESACKIETLILTGANLVIADNQIATAATKPKALKILKEAGIPVLEDHKKVEGEFDFCLDCGAEFVDLVKPRKAIVELTRSGAIVYSKRKMNIPVLSVDDSKLKSLETFFGTGEGFVRAFQMLTDEDIKDKKFVIFGFGKVGKGVAYFLKKHTDNIVIIDVDAQALKSAQDKGLNALDLNQFKEVKREIDSAYAVASATGIEHALSKSFKPKDKKVFEGKYLANIGIDEFGDLFDETEILYNKKWPINFALPDPTKMRYLDPSFYAHNLGSEIILSKDFEPGYHTFPEDIDDEIMKEWQDFHDEDISLSQE